MRASLGSEWALLLVLRCPLRPAPTLPVCAQGPQLGGLGKHWDRLVVTGRAAQWAGEGSPCTLLLPAGWEPPAWSMERGLLPAPIPPFALEAAPGRTHCQHGYSWPCSAPFVSPLRVCCNFLCD